MAFDINEIKSKFALQGARPTLFEVFIANPYESMNDIQFLVSATSIPESQVGNIPVPYFGRIVNFAGDRSYLPWTVTVMNDEDFKIRNALEAWSDVINTKRTNIRVDNNYKSTAVVRQYNKVGEIIREYEFIGIYPAIIEPIRLDWADTNTFERFNVQFIYDYWRVLPGETGIPGELG